MTAQKMTAQNRTITIPFFRPAGRIKRLLAAGVSLALLSHSVRAIVLPPVEDGDTAATASAANSAGKATSLPVSGTKSALMRFGVGNLNIPSANVRNARLTVYVVSVLKPGSDLSNNLEVRLATSDWHEANNAGGVAPTVTSQIADLGVPAAATAKHFVTCDVTGAVKFWLDNPADDFGFEITTAGTTSVLLGSKEGSSSGFPASLEIDNGELGDSVTIDGSGNVGIGTTPSDKLTVGGSTRVEGTFEAENANGSFQFNGFEPGSGAVLLGSFLATSNHGPQLRFAGAPGNGWFDIGQNDAANFVIENNDNPALTVTPDGNVGIGTTAPNDLVEVSGVLRANGYRCRLGYGGTTMNNTFNIAYPTGGSTGAHLWIDAVDFGTITTSSDRRLKEQINPIKDNALDRVMTLKPVSFKYRNIPGTMFTGGTETVEGFVADELQAVVPSAVNGKKDALTSDGKIQPQTVTAMPVVAVLTKAVQEQEQQIKAKDAEIAALKAASATLAEKVSALEARDRAREARLSRIEKAVDHQTASLRLSDTTGEELSLNK